MYVTSQNVEAPVENKEFGYIRSLNKYFTLGFDGVIESIYTTFKPVRLLVENQEQSLPCRVSRFDAIVVASPVDGIIVMNGKRL